MFIYSGNEEFQCLGIDELSKGIFKTMVVEDSLAGSGEGA